MPRAETWQVDRQRSRTEKKMEEEHENIGVTGKMVYPEAWAVAVRAVTFSFPRHFAPLPAHTTG
jgi:hypothetical protein